MLQNQRLTIVRTVDGVRETVARWRSERCSVGLIPTMGALHAGHLALVDRARRENDRILATVFVNPLQFGPSEDFAAYPRDDARDFELLTQHRCDAVFAPSVREMFPHGDASLDGASTCVSVPRLGARLCGESRPGHFDGVATIVLRLLLIALADNVYFGEKDYQQLTIVRRLVADVNVPVRVVGIPTVREADGLALSSRNVYLNAEQRAAAPALQRVLAAVRDAVAAGAAIGPAVADGRAALRAAGFDRVEYVTVAAGDTLETLDRLVPGARVFGAAWLGRTRLIDNLALPKNSGARADEEVGSILTCFPDE
jgi:pantoate--beta-alanine ligase